MAKSALHPWVEARPSPLKGALKKAFCAFFFFCAAFSQRNTYETQSKTTRIHPVIYSTKATHNINCTQLVSATETTTTDANTRENLPEASPKGPGTTHLMALAGQRSRITERTLATQGLASRPPQPEYKTPQPEKKTSNRKQTTRQNY